MTRYDLLIPTIPHRHEVLCALLAELGRQMLPGAGVIVWRDNLEHSYGDKCQGLLEASDADYVAFMDDDDWPSEDYLSAVLGALEGGPDYVGWPEMYTVDGGQGRIIVHSLHDRSAEYPGVQVGLVAHKNPIRREMALLGRWEGGWGADTRGADQVIATGRVRSEAWIPKPVYHYRWRSHDEFRTPRAPVSGPLPELPAYDWLRVL